MTTHLSEARVGRRVEPKRARFRFQGQGRGIGTQTLGVAAGCVLAFLYAPIITLIIFSFDAKPVSTLPLTEWTLDWYEKAFTNEVLLTGLENSLMLATAVVMLCLVIGIPTALALDRYDFPGKAVVRRLFILPIALPGIITGVAMLNFFSAVGVPLSLWTVLVGHAAVLTAIVVMSVFARLQRFDRRIEEASADLGARPFQTFLHVTLPNIRSAIIGSSLIVFTLSFDEIPVTFFLTGRHYTLPMYIWSVVRLGMTPEINAIGSVIIGTSIMLLLLAVFIMSEPGRAVKKGRSKRGAARASFRLSSGV